jgi:DNA-directed RNA polymerase subunit E'/Rpb7
MCIIYFVTLYPHKTILLIYKIEFYSGIYLVNNIKSVQLYIVRMSEPELTYQLETHDGGAKVQNTERKLYGVYTKSVMENKVVLAITEIGKTLKQNLEMKIVKKISGKCINEGYIQPKSINIIKYSAGIVSNNYVEFCVLFECMCCLPVEGMEMECKCKTITKAGIHAQVIDGDGNIPVTVFVARDHHHLDNRLNTIKEDTMIRVRVIGVRYELNDPYICVIAKWIEHTNKK